MSVNAGDERLPALVIGGGPAGLMAAEVLADGGVVPVVVDAMPSLGRKFLMAGKSGLNLTKDEAPDQFLGRITGDDSLIDTVRRFGPEEVQNWARALGEPLFTGSTKRVFPKSMKASPLLRKWLGRLDGAGVQFRTRWRWVGWEGDCWRFETAEGPRRVRADIVVMALGGSSWARLGSNGVWADEFAKAGIKLAPFKPANVGFSVDWSAHMARHFGTPMKGTRLASGSVKSRGEWVVSAKGIEGGGVYEVSAAAREGAALTLDLLPDLSVDEVARKLSKPRAKMSLSNHLRKSLGLSSVQRALLQEWGRPLPEGSDFAMRIKSLTVPVIDPLPMDQAISTAGGVAAETLDGLMLRPRPGTFIAGEMLDWEAPTGGYLLTTCFATGRAAARQALDFLSKSK